MKVQLAYGRDGLSVDLPDNTVVVRASPVPRIPDEPAAVRHALRNPIGCASLSSFPGKGNKAVVVHTDITRATPNDRILPEVLAEIEASGVARENITLLNALGTHRPQTEKELVGMLGEKIVKNFRCVQHDGNDDAMLVSLGVTRRGHPVRVNKLYMEAGIRVLTGFIEPHFFAGFSGGPKLVLPGISGAESVQTNHGAKMIGDSHSTWGITDGNPIWEECMEIAVKTQPSMIVNVALNPERRITGVFAGDLRQAHREGCRFVREHSMVRVKAPFDVVVVTNSGYPLDQNLYQCVKGMSAAARIVKPGGAILLVGACADGLPDHGRYATLLQEAGSPEAMLRTVNKPGFSEPDQWQVQIQAMIQQKARVFVYSDGLSNDQIRRVLLEPCRDISTTVRTLLREKGPGATLCAMPEGPQTIADLI